MVRYLHYSHSRLPGEDPDVWKTLDKQQKRNIYKMRQKIIDRYEKMVDPFTEEVVALMMPYIDICELENLASVNSLFEKYVNKRLETLKQVHVGRFDREVEMPDSFAAFSVNDNFEYNVILRRAYRETGKKVSKKVAFKKFVRLFVAKCPNLTRIYGSSSIIKFFDDETMQKFSSLKKLSKVNFANVNFSADALDKFLSTVGPQLAELSFVDVKALATNTTMRYSYYDRVIGNNKEKGFDSLINLQVFIAHNFSYIYEDYFRTMGSDKLKILRLRSTHLIQKGYLGGLELVLEKSPNLEVLDISGLRVVDDAVFRAMVGLKKLAELDVSNLKVVSYDPSDERRIAAVQAFGQCLAQMINLKVFNAQSMQQFYALPCDQYLKIIDENLPNVAEIRGIGRTDFTSATPQLWSRLTAVHLNLHSENATLAIRDVYSYLNKINVDQNLREFSFECVTLDFSGEYLRPFAAAKSLKKLALKSKGSSGDESNGFKKYLFAFLGEKLENLSIDVPGNNGKLVDDDFVIMADMSPKLKSIALRNFGTNSFDFKVTMAEKMAYLKSAHLCFGQHGVMTKMKSEEILSFAQTCTTLKRLVLCYPLYHELKQRSFNGCALNYCERVEKQVYV